MLETGSYDVLRMKMQLENPDMLINILSSNNLIYLVVHIASLSGMDYWSLSNPILIVLEILLLLTVATTNSPFLDNISTSF